MVSGKGKSICHVLIFTGFVQRATKFWKSHYLLIAVILTYCSHLFGLVVISYLTGPFLPESCYCLFLEMRWTILINSVFAEYGRIGPEPIIGLVPFYCLLLIYSGLILRTQMTNQFFLAWESSSFVQFFIKSCKITILCRITNIIRCFYLFPEPC